MLRQILIAVDGSSGGSAAARLGADVAARYGASVVVVHVSNPPAVLSLSGSTPVDALDDLQPLAHGVADEAHAPELADAEDPVDVGLVEGAQEIGLGGFGGRH